MSLFSRQASAMRTQASGRTVATLRSAWFGLLATLALAPMFGAGTARADGIGREVTPQAASSANDVPCTESGGCKCPLQTSAVAGSTAKPIWTYDGSERLAFTDLVVGRNFPIRITRNYNSRSEYDSAIGYGWAFGFDKRLFEYPDGSIVVRSGCGSKSKFVFSGGAYVAPQNGLQGTLTALGNGTYELRYAGGNLDRFDADGRLSSIVSASGAKLELLYDSRGRLPLIGTSPRALDPNTPMVVAYQPRVTRIQERGADGTLTGYYVDFQYNDTTGRVTSVTASDGRVVNYGFDVTGTATRGNLVSVSGLTDYSQTFAYTVDANNPDPHNVTSITDGTGATPVVNQYDSSDRVKKQIEGSQILDFAYGNLTTTVTQTVKNSSGSTIQTRDTTYVFAAGGYLTKITDPQGNETRYTLDGNKDITRTELWEKQGSNLVLLKAVDNTYNGFGQMLTETVTLDSVGGQAAEVITTTWTYDNGWVSSVQTVSNKYSQIFRTEYTFNRDAQNRPVSIASVKRRKDDGTFATTSFTYCTAAEAAAANSICPDTVLVKQVDGPRTDVSDVATITYYGSTDTSGCSGTGNCWHRGDRKTITNALGQSITLLRYDDAGRAVKVQDANSVIAELVFHPRGWLNQQIVRGANDAVTTDDQITTFDHDARGNLTKVTSPDGNFATLTYDGRDQLTRIDDQLQGWMVYKYDSAGNVESREWRQGTGGSTLKRSQALTVDVLDRVVQAAGGTAGNTASLTYDAAGRQTKVTDPNSVEATQTYDDLDRLIATVSDSGSGGLMVSTGMAYDAVGNLRSVVDPKGLSTNYVYDALGRMTQQASPDSGTTNYTYDDAGNLKTKTDARSITATTTYDALNRPLTVTYPTTSENVTYVYDTVNAACITGETFALGQLTKMTDPSGTTEYCYDRFGNLTRKVQTTGGVAHVVRYTYTLANQPASLTYPDGTLVDYVRDANSQVKEVGVTVAGGTRQVLVGNATYLPAGPASSWQFGTTRTLTRTYDQDYRATGVRDPGVGGLDIGYVYDNASYLKQITTQSTAAIRAKFDYDALGRLLDRKNAADVIQESYTYDGTGNRLSNTVGGTTTTNTYPTTNHRLTQVGAVARTYDNAGNLTAIGGTTREYGYNDANRMSLAKAGGVLQATYLYNGFGEQVQRQTGVTTRFVYDEGGSLLGQYDSTGAVVQEYVYLNGITVGTILSTSQGTGNARLKWVQTDALGTPRAIIDPTRSLAIWRWDENSEAFGNGSPNTDPDADGTNVVFDLRFPGQRYDAASGLYYNYYRDYDPATGRYVQSDPIGLLGGMSTYGYVSGNPVRGFDEDGLRECWRWQEGCHFSRKPITGREFAIGVGIGIAASAYILVGPFEVPFIAAASGIGAFTGFFGNIFGQVVASGGNWHCVSMKNAFIAAGVGGVAGGIAAAAAPLMTVSVESVMLLGGGANVAQYAITQYANNESMSWGDASWNFAIGAFGGKISGKFSKIKLPSVVSDQRIAASINNEQMILENITAMSSLRSLLGASEANLPYKISHNSGGSCDQECEK